MTTGHERVYYSLHQLVQLSSDLQSDSHQLEDFRTKLGDEHLDYVKVTSEQMLQKLHQMLQNVVSAVNAGERPGNPMENKVTRHDIRNQVAVIKGFGDLMRMDMENAHPASRILDHIRSQCDEFVAVLDAVKASADGSQQMATG